MSAIYADTLTSPPFDGRDSVPALPDQAAYDARASKRRYRSSRNFDLGTPTFAQSSTHLPSQREHRLSGRFSRDSESSRSNSGSQYSHGRSAVSLVSQPSPNPADEGDVEAELEDGSGLPRASYAAHMRVAHMIARHKAAQSSASLALAEIEEPERNHRVFFRKNSSNSNSRVGRWVSKLVRPFKD